MLVVLLFSSVVTASPYDVYTENLRVFQLGVIKDGSGLEKNLTRAELSAIAVRLCGLEYMKYYQRSSTSFKDVNGWAVPYVNMAYDLGLMKGVNEYFYPNRSISYVELLTILMRVLGYEDGVDFVKYPEDYYNKSLEIGLANLYIPHHEIITKEIVIRTIDKALSLNMRNMDKDLASFYSYISMPSMEIPPKDYSVDSINLGSLNFNTTLVGVFSGVLGGVSDLFGYRISLLSGSGNTLESVSTDKNGGFSIEGFDISPLGKLQGYKYEIYSPNGTLVLWGDLK